MLNPLESNRPARLRLILTCEHGGNRVPVRYAACFREAEVVLASHRGWDAGSLDLARQLSRRLRAPLIAATVTRLLVELNRSPNHPRLFSEFTRDLPQQARDEILRRYYAPHRQRVQAAVAAVVAEGAAALHVGVHTFAPSLNDKVRVADVGLLYDPGRAPESDFCRVWQRQLRRVAIPLVVRRNYPYLGKSDGLTTSLRRRFPPSSYLGLELEVNQRWVARGSAEFRELAVILADSLATALAHGDGKDAPGAL